MYKPTMGDIKALREAQVRYQVQIALVGQR